MTLPARTFAGAIALSPPSVLLAAIRRVIALSTAAGCVEVIGYLDCNSIYPGIYPGIMTGHTVQLGLTLATAQWSRVALIGHAAASLFIGGIIASVARRSPDCYAMATPRRQEYQSTFAPENFTTSPHLTMSSRMVFASWTDVPPIGVKPRDSRRARKACVASAALSTWLIRMVMSRGVPFGAKTPNHVSDTRAG
jgi:hypothetical protein